MQAPWPSKTPSHLSSSFSIFLERLHFRLLFSMEGSLNGASTDSLGQMTLYCGAIFHTAAYLTIFWASTH